MDVFLNQVLLGFMWAAFLTLSASKKFLLSVIIAKAELQHPMSMAFSLISA